MTLLSDQTEASADEQATATLEELVRADYERCHPDDTFEHLKQRARFSKEDRGLLGDWMALASARARTTCAAKQAGDINNTGDENDTQR